MSPHRARPVVLACLLLSACSSAGRGGDAGSSTDSGGGHDASLRDGGADAAADSGLDASSVDGGPADAASADAGAEDAGAADGGAADGGAVDAGVADAGTDGGGCTDPACEDPCLPARSTARTLDCDSGTVTGDSSDGSELLSGYECSTYSYPGRELVYRFQNAEAATVTVTADRSGSAEDFDLYALEGGDGTIGCDASTACVDYSVNIGTESVTFDVDAGQVVYLAWDQFGAAGATSATLTLEVSCAAAADGGAG